jgi:hypothetical protein
MFEMNRPKPDIPPNGADEPPEGAAAPAEALEREIMDELSEMRGIMLGLARRLATQAQATDEPEALTRLNNAAVRTARAHRQVAVLQLEMAGKRPIAGRAEPREAPAAQPGSRGNPQSRPRPVKERFPDGLPYTNGDYSDNDDYTDEERQELAERKFGEGLKPLVAAMDQDFLAAGYDDLLGQSPETKFKLIYYIPHPALDRAAAGADPNLVAAVFGWIGLLPPVAGTGPPEEWERYLANREVMLRHKASYEAQRARPRS